MYCFFRRLNISQDDNLNNVFTTAYFCGNYKPMHNNGKDLFNPLPEYLRAIELSGTVYPYYCVVIYYENKSQSSLHTYIVIHKCMIS